ncbi:MAG TPA: MGMT family protein [Gammaproteobacteria bacterium]|nr:MGMT family protein [Gammaproteobacteria bacterium]
MPRNGHGLTPGGLYERIYTTVRRIPAGRVASYGRIAALTGGCSARQVGYAMAALPSGSTVPWHRVVNARGAISRRADGRPSAEQRRRLTAEGIVFDARGRIDMDRYGWSGAGGAGHRELVFGPARRS